MFPKQVEHALCFCQTLAAILNYLLCLYILKAVMEMCQVAQEKIVYKRLGGDWEASALVAWTVHKCICFWVTLGYFVPDLFYLVSHSFPESISHQCRPKRLHSTHLHRQSIRISRLKWPVKTGQQSVDLAEEKNTVSIERTFSKRISPRQLSPNL